MPHGLHSPEARCPVVMSRHDSGSHRHDSRRAELQRPSATEGDDKTPSSSVMEVWRHALV